MTEQQENFISFVLMVMACALIATYVHFYVIPQKSGAGSIPCKITNNPVE